MRHKNKTISGVGFHPRQSLKFMMHISFRYKFGLNIYAGKLRIYDPMWVFNYYSFDDIYGHQANLVRRMPRCFHGSVHFQWCTYNTENKKIYYHSIHPAPSFPGKEKRWKKQSVILQKDCVVKNKFIARDRAKSLLNCLTILPIFSRGEIPVFIRL